MPANPPPQGGESTGADLDFSDDEEDEDEDLEARILRDKARLQSGQSADSGNNSAGAGAGNQKVRKRIGESSFF
jgi:hypothetical protein